jgi:hypothetical protein
MIFRIAQRLFWYYEERTKDVMHMNEQEPQPSVREAYVDELIERLMQQYLTAQLLPGSNRRELSPQLLHKLCRAIMAEGYGA